MQNTEQAKTPAPQDQTPANKEAISAGATALKEKVEKLENKVVNIPKVEEKPQTRRTLKQALDAMDKEIADLTKELDRKLGLRSSLNLDIATTEATIDAIQRIREDFA